MREAMARVRLMQLASQALPIGGFSHSQGLEAAVESGTVHDESTALHWIFAVLEYSMASYELPMLCDMTEAWDGTDRSRLEALNEEFLASRESAELRAATAQMGHSLRALLAALPDVPEFLRVTAKDMTEPSLPCLWSGVANAWGLPMTDSAAAYAWSWAENQVLVAMKSIPIGQSAGQRILWRVGQRLGEVVAELAASSADPSCAPPRSNFAPALAILCCQHETQYSRLFRS